jgi:hypothetical protein
MDSKIRQIIDRLVPRGGEKPGSIHVSFEDYLSRLANFNRKLAGIRYRMLCWSAICEEHKIKFDKMNSLADSLKAFDADKPKITKLLYSSRDISLENEFEILIYSLTSTLSALTRVVACFLEKSTDLHSHSKLSTVLSKYKDFESSYLVVNNANTSWVKELTERRDAATHYIALSITASIIHSKPKSSPKEKKVLRVGITKKPIKYASIWEDEVPTSGGSTRTTITYDNGMEKHELMDLEREIVIRRDKPLENIPELIDGEEYIQNLYKDFQVYIKELLESLANKMEV